MANLALDIQGCTVAYHDTPVLWDVSLAVPPGTVTGVLGPNGAGKTTLLKAVLGLVPMASGRVRVFGASYASQRERVGYVPQRGSVDWDFPTDALDVVLMGLYGQLGWFQRPGSAEKKSARAALKQVGMLDYANRQISQLSGGQQQRVFWHARWCKTPTCTSWTSHCRAWMLPLNAPSCACCTTCATLAKQSSWFIMTCTPCLSTSTGCCC